MHAAKKLRIEIDASCCATRAVIIEMITATPAVRDMTLVEMHCVAMVATMWASTTSACRHSLMVPPNSPNELWPATTPSRFPATPCDRRPTSAPHRTPSGILSRGVLTRFWPDGFERASEATHLEIGTQIDGGIGGEAERHTFQGQRTARWAETRVAVVTKRVPRSIEATRNTVHAMCGRCAVDAVAPPRAAESTIWCVQRRNPVDITNPVP
jgi:hypothetical protein